ncbi:MAG: hypothetical protein ACRDT0_26615, partial [Pseudonocardiaceae bacterium]
MVTEPAALVDHDVVEHQAALAPITSAGARERTSRDHRAHGAEVFGDYIDVYDLTRAVGDGATVPVTFAPRLIRVGLAGDVTEED